MARSLNGTSDLIAVDSAHLTNGATAFSISAWVKKSARANDQIYGEGNTGAAGPFMQFNFDATTGQHIEIAARSASSGSSDVMAIGTIVAADGTWHHVCVTQNASSLCKLYVDGVADSSGSRTALSNSNSQTFNTARIGVLTRNTNANFYSGTIAEVATWTRELTASEVKLLAAGHLASELGPAHYWPLWGADSPEPDIGNG